MEGKGREREGRGFAGPISKCSCYTRLDESFGDRDAGSEVCNAPLQLSVNELSLISSNSRRSKDHDCVL